LSPLALNTHGPPLYVTPPFYISVSRHPPIARIRLSPLSYEDPVETDGTCVEQRHMRCPATTMVREKSPLLRPSHGGPSVLLPLCIFQFFESDPGSIIGVRLSPLFFNLKSDSAPFFPDPVEVALGPNPSRGRHFFLGGAVRHFPLRLSIRATKIFCRSPFPSRSPSP